jgi:hypothetical protein
VIGLAAALMARVGTAAASAAPTPPSHACSDPCLTASRSARQDCVSSASGAFQSDLEGCLELDRTCLDACRAERQDCRTATGLGEARAACQQAQAADKAECTARFRVGSRKWARCIYRARTRMFRCRLDASREARRALRECRRSFVACSEACAPGVPPDGVAVCRQEAKAERQAAVDQCQDDFVLSASACIDKDATCVDGCDDARDASNAPTQADFQAAYAQCTSTRNAAVAACQAEFPDDQAALEQCIEDAQAAAFTCRDAALEAAQPGLAACSMTWGECIQACPAPG